MKIQKKETITNEIYLIFNIQQHYSIDLISMEDHDEIESISNKLDT